MNFPFKEARKKLLSGDFSGLFRLSNSKSSIHPSEVANLFTSIPTDKAIDAFQSFPKEQQVKVFPYLDLQLQRKTLRKISREDARYIVNK